MTSKLENKVVSNQKSADRFNAVSDELEQAQVALQAQINAAQKKFEKAFPKLVKDFFAAVPQIKSVTWTQYSPHFNDGDACTFNVNEVFFATDENKDFGVYRDEEDEEDYDEDEDEGGEVAERDENFFSGTFYSLKTQKFLTKEQIAMCKKLDELISCNEDTMESMFGDGYVIVLRADGIETQDYDHD
jgi:hypothetical protein